MTSSGHEVDPLVSVVMPVYNSSTTIGEAIDSILRQSYETWELIVVDDASTDDSLAIARAYEVGDARVRVIPLSMNAGSGKARNVAIESCSGKYLAVMDADDLSLPDRLARQVDALEANPDLAAVAMQLEEFGLWGGPVISSWPTHRGDIRQRIDRGKIPIPHPSTMFVTELVRAAGGYDEYCRRAQDFALFLALGDREFGCLPTVGVKYRTDRPVSFAYVLKNERYAELARKRHAPKTPLGVGSVEPTKLPAVSPALAARSAINWIKRSVQEKSAEASTSANSQNIDYWPTWRTVSRFLSVEMKANRREPKSLALVVLLRLCQCMIGDRTNPQLIGKIATLFYRAMTEIVFGTELRPKTRVGKGLVIYHGFGLVVNDQTIIGESVTLRNGVTIGNKEPGGAAPVIGSGVEVGANAVILGDVLIGNGARIGAGSVVTKSVQPGDTVVGNPARSMTIRQRGD